MSKHFLSALSLTLTLPALVACQQAQASDHPNSTARAEHNGCDHCGGSHATMHGEHGDPGQESSDDVEYASHTDMHGDHDGNETSKSSTSPDHAGRAAVHPEHHGADAKKSSHASGPVAIVAGDNGFLPNKISLERGKVTVLRFTRTTDATCATRVVFPELGIEKPLPLNEPVEVEIPTDRPRTLTFQCGMGMYKSQVVIK